MRFYLVLAWRNQMLVYFCRNVFGLRWMRVDSLVSTWRY